MRVISSATSWSPSVVRSGCDQVWLPKATWPGVHQRAQGRRRCPSRSGSSRSGRRSAGPRCPRANATKAATTSVLVAVVDRERQVAPRARQAVHHADRWRDTVPGPVTPARGDRGGRGQRARGRRGPRSDRGTGRPRPTATPARPAARASRKPSALHAADRRTAGPAAPWHAPFDAPEPFGALADRLRSVTDLITQRDITRTHASKFGPHPVGGDVRGAPCTHPIQLLTLRAEPITHKEVRVLTRRCTA